MRTGSQTTGKGITPNKTSDLILSQTNQKVKILASVRTSSVRPYGRSLVQHWSLDTV